MLYSNGSNFCTEQHRHAQDNAIEPQELRARPRPLRSVQVIATYELAGVECWVSQPQNGMPGMLVTMTRQYSQLGRASAAKRFMAACQNRIDASKFDKAGKSKAGRPLYIMTRRRRRVCSSWRHS